MLTMSFVAALADGCQRVLRAPALLAGLWIVAVFVSGPVQVAPGDAFVALVDAAAMDASFALAAILWHPAALAHGLVATFLAGGVLDRLARDRRTGSFGFFGAAGMHFFRFLRLGVLAVPLYWIVFFPLHGALVTTGSSRYIVLGVLILLLHLVFDYARVRMVVEDRRSAMGAVAAAVRFIVRHPGAVVPLALVNATLAAATWWLAAQYAIGETAAVYAYLIARILLRLVFMGSQVALFQHRLAHAGYMARPVAAWPDSPSAEAVRPR
jgi:hypothetical protein